MKEQKEFKELLAHPFNEEKNSEEFQRKCYEIAKSLFCNYFINCNGKKYYLVEIEFYYWENRKWDEKWNTVTYPRNCEAGQLYYHLSGVDICFDSHYNEEKLNDDAWFGGILIRAIRGEDGVTGGPWNCMLKLLNECKEGNMPRLEYSQGSGAQKERIKSTWRALGKDDREKEMTGKFYLCFYDSSIQNWNQRRVRLNRKLCRLEHYESRYNIDRFDLQK